MHYQNIFLSTLIALSVVHVPSTHAMKPNNKLQAKREAMRQQLATRSQSNPTSPSQQIVNTKQQPTQSNFARINQQITTASTHANSIITAKLQPLLIQTKPFLDACAYGRTNEVSDYITNGVSVDSKDNRDLTGLHFACNYGHFEVAQILVQNSADVHAEDYDIRTPLHYACTNGNYDIANLLLNKGANANAADINRRTPMHFACNDGHLTIVTLLAAHQAHMNPKNCYHAIPLFFACQNGHLDIVEFLTEDRTNINTQNYQKLSPLHAACYNNNSSPKIISLLIKRGALVNTHNIDKSTPLHTACHYGNIDTVKILIESKAHINAQDNKGFTPFDIARHYGHTDIVNFLTNISPNIQAIMVVKQITQHNTVQTIVNQTILDMCRMGLKNDIARLIREHPEIVMNIRDANNNTPLHYACRYKFLPIVKLLIKYNADVNAENINLHTPLHSACETANNNDTINFLLDNKADIEAQDNQGATPLHDTCARGNFSAMEFLAKRGANIHAQTNIRMTPLHIACQNGHLNIVILLLKKDANINSKTLHKMTPLHYAVICGHTAIVEHLLKMGADTTIESAHGITALEFAYEQEKSAIINLFAQYGAKVVSEEEAEKCGKEFFAKLNQTDKTDQTKQKKEPQTTIKSTKKQKRKNQQQLSAKEPAPTVTEQTDATEPHAVSTEAIVLPEQPAETISVTNPITTETPIVMVPVTNNNNLPTEISKKTAAKPLAQQPKNNVTKKSSNTPVHIASPVNTPDQYQIVRPKKWPRHLVHNSQINTMYEHLNELKKWPLTQGQGLDIETLQGKLKGFLCMRVGGSRVIFTVDNANRTIIIDEIALHHDGYKK